MAASIVPTILFAILTNTKNKCPETLIPGHLAIYSNPKLRRLQPEETSGFGRIDWNGA